MSSLRQIFESLVDLTEPERLTALRALELPEDQRKWLEAMLVTELELPALLDLRLEDAITALRLDEPPAQQLIGTQVGPFRIVEMLGQGGSAIVFRATRPAGNSEQTVALKLLRAGLASADAERRFKREQAILAQVTHPCIARLIEGGTGPWGLPYIAMEYVAGAAITLAAKTRRLGLVERIHLVVQLCRTIDAAHAALVVHCDLKPSNILLGEKGELKVLDFGIARLLDAGSEHDATRTIALTPGYAAPEQYKLGQPTTAVDVFSIGIVLSELLTGQRPRAFECPRASVAVQIPGAPAPPSGMPGAALLARQLRGDLDAIIAKATAPEPAQRFRSAGALGDDLERYLNGTPIEARKTSHLLRAAKFVRRNRASVIVSSALLLALIASLALVQWRSIQVQRAAENALQQAQRADAIRDAVFEVISEADPGTPREQDVTILSAVSNATERLLIDHGGESRGRLELLSRFADTLGRHGRIERARDVLRQAYTQSVAEFGRDDSLSRSIIPLLIGYEIDTGRVTEARSLIDGELARTSGSTAAQRNGLLRHSADVAWRQRDFARARRDSAAAVELATQASDEELLRKTLSDQGVVLLSIDEPAAAVRVFEDVLRRNIAKFGENHEKVSLAASGLARGYRRVGDLERAETYARQALAIDRAIYKGDHWNTANHLNALLMIQIARRKFDEALPTAQEYIRILDTTLAEGHIERIMAPNELGSIYLQLYRYEDAKNILEGVVAKGNKVMGPGNGRLSIARVNYSYALLMSGKTESAVHELELAISYIEQAGSVDRALLAKAFAQRARIAIVRSEKDVMKWLERSAAADRALPAEEAARWKGRAELLQASVQIAARDYQASLETLRRAEDAMAGNAKVAAMLPVEHQLLLAKAKLGLGAADATSTIANSRSALSRIAFPPDHLLALERELPAGQ